MKKSLIKLGVVAVLIIAVAFLALNGLQVGKYILKPVSSAISLGLDLRGGVSTEYIATDTSMENYESLLEGTVSALRTRLTNAGFTEANVAIQGNDRILVEIPDVDDPEEVIEIIGTPAHLEFRDPLGNVVVEGKNIKKAEPMQDEKGICFVSFEMDEEGTAAFRDATSEFIGETISIYLDDELISAPVVDEVIPDGKGMISAGDEINVEDSYEFATNLSMLIQSGALPLDIEEIETRAISATLGLEAIDGAVIAGAVGLILVMLFMLAVYRLPGLAADMALLVYILIVFYALAIFGAQLTLQGIAGILLGIGMAVDANVVIFERFREELKEGRTPLNAVKFGFRNAGRAVIDSNVTTLIAAIALMLFGTGTIKGFAITLTISVIASLITAVFVTRGLLILICKLGISNRKAYTR
ncbi:MAG: protein translocase subunit SecD [Clostridiales bacterium]|nr:protein translocase subunit SecD [Clostridiales bacterium]